MTNWCRAYDCPERVSSNHTYCPGHACWARHCNQPRLRNHNYRQRHGCTYDGSKLFAITPSARVMSVKTTRLPCREANHDRMAASCTLVRVEDADTCGPVTETSCESHRCEGYYCNREKLAHSKGCELHACRWTWSVGCRNPRPPDSDMCPSGKCQVYNCWNHRLTNSNGCELHTYQVQIQYWEQARWESGNPALGSFCCPAPFKYDMSMQPASNISPPFSPRAKPASQPAIQYHTTPIAEKLVGKRGDWSESACVDVSYVELTHMNVSV